MSSSSLLNRQFRTLKNVAGGSFKIMQFNILAHGLSGIFETSTEKKSFDHAPKENLIWEYRCPLIIEEILRNDADIVCIQENDKYQDLLNQLGESWEGIQKEKLHSPCEFTTGIKDGLSIYWKKEKFQLKNTGLIGNYKTCGKDRQVYLGIELQHIETNNDVIVVTTHLKAAKTQDGENIRKIQVDELQQLLLEKYGDSSPIIFTADLNAAPHFSELNYGGNTHTYEPLAYNSVMSSLLGLLSSQKEMLNGEEPQFTSAKVRKTLIAHTIDYIFYQPKVFEPIGYLSYPTLEEISPYYLPNSYYPSDHLAIMTEFTFVDDGKEN